MNNAQKDTIQAWAKQIVEEFNLADGTDFGGLLKFVSDGNDQNEFWMTLAENLKQIIGDEQDEDPASIRPLIKKVLSGPENKQYGARFELLVASKLRGKFEYQIIDERNCKYDIVVQAAAFPNHEFKIETKMPISGTTNRETISQRLLDSHQPLDLSREERIIRDTIRRNTRRGAHTGVDLLLFDISHLGISWIRPIEIWGSILNSWFSDPESFAEFPIIALCLTSLDTTIIRTAHTSLNSLSDVKRSFVQKIMTAFDPQLEYPN